MRVEQLLERLEREYLKVKILQSLLDGLLFFLGANLVLFLLNINLVNIGAQEVSVLGLFNVTVRVIMLGALAVVATGFSLYYRLSKYSVEIFEEENPELREILRTARDNLDQQNIVSQALFEEVLEEARRVTSESIIPAKRIIYKMLAVGILSFLTVMSGLADFQLQNSTDLFDAPDSIDDLTGGKKDEGFQINDGSDLYGKESDIDPGDLEVDFEVKGSGGSAEEAFDPTEAPPAEELTLDATAGSSNDDIELAKQYSVAVRNIG